MGAFVRDASHWLHCYSPAEWIRAAQGELSRAEDAARRRNLRAAVAGFKRAAGMALNAALIVEPNDAWGRTYVEHLKGLSEDASAPQAVRRAAALVVGTEPPGPSVVPLRSPASDARLVEATRDVMAHACAVVLRRGEPL